MSALPLTETECFLIDLEIFLAPLLTFKSYVTSFHPKNMFFFVLLTLSYQVNVENAILKTLISHK